MPKSNDREVEIVYIQIGGTAPDNIFDMETFHAPEADEDYYD